jgi:hypothetical protein
MNQFKDIALAVFIGLALAALLLHSLGALFPLGAA